MKNLEQIKEEVARDDNFQGWQELFEVCARYDYGRLENAIIEIAQRYADECARESLRSAGEGLIEWSYERYPNFRTAIASIISETNLPRHISSKELDEDIKVVVDKNFYDLL